MINIVAHRGYPAKHPENTIEAFQAAVDAGARWVEVDVQLRGCTPVMAHDPGQIAHGERLALFADWLAAHPDVTALIDLKPDSLMEYGRDTVVEACLDVMHGAWHPIGFDYGALKLAVQLGAPAPGLVVTSFNEGAAVSAEAIGARWLIMNQMFLPPGPVPAGPWEWMVYEVATPEQARSLMERGVRWLETMDFSAIRDGIASCSQ